MTQPDPVTRPVQLSALVRDERLRFRCPRQGDDADAATVERYAEAMCDAGGWGGFPALLVVELTEGHKFRTPAPAGAMTTYPAGALVLVGGFTRTAAAAVLDIAAGPAVVIAGTWADAERLAWLENANHGRPRSVAEKATVIAAIRARHPGQDLSFRDVERLSGIPKSTVERIESYRPAPAAEVAPCDADDPADAMLTTRSVSSTQGRQVEKDLWGRPLRDNRERERFAAVPEALRAARLVLERLHALLKLKHGEDGQGECRAPALEAVDVQSIYLAVSAEIDRITDNVPWIVCPKCDGDGEPRPEEVQGAKRPPTRCTLCRGRTTLTKVQADGLTPDMEKKARQWATKEKAAA